MKKILILSGPNLAMLSQRESIYGTFSYQDIQNKLREIASNKVELEFFQSDFEGAIIYKINTTVCDGIIINPGAFSHTSIGIRDALSIKKCAKIEVHITNLSRREDFRQVLMTAPACDGFIMGLGINSYRLALVDMMLKIN